MVEYKETGQRNFIICDWNWSQETEFGGFVCRRKDGEGTEVLLIKLLFHCPPFWKNGNTNHQVPSARTWEPSDPSPHIHLSHLIHKDIPSSLPLLVTLCIILDSVFLPVMHRDSSPMSLHPQLIHPRDIFFGNLVLIWSGFAGQVGPSLPRGIGLWPLAVGSGLRPRP